jgi:hypothetical protein
MGRTLTWAGVISKTRRKISLRIAAQCPQSQLAGAIGTAEARNQSLEQDVAALC